MRFVGQTEVDAFIAQWPAHGDHVRAWLSEMKYRRWKDAASLEADFRELDLSRLPTVIFFLSSARVRIDTLIHFRAGVVMLTGIVTQTTRPDPTANDWNTHHGH